MNLKLTISATSGKSTVEDAETGDVLANVIACQLSGGDLGFAPLVHLTLANVEIVRETVQAAVVEKPWPFMGGNS